MAGEPPSDIDHRSSKLPLAVGFAAAGLAVLPPRPTAEFVRDAEGAGVIAGKEKPGPAVGAIGEAM